MLKNVSHTAYRLPSQEVASVARHRRQRCASRRAPMGAVEGFYPGRWRYRTTATWPLSFHCGMNPADTSAWRAPRREIGVELDVYPRDPPRSGERRDRG